jgi:glycosyltransferase involved in cell wall biosynthesis
VPEPAYGDHRYALPRPAGVGTVMNVKPPTISIVTPCLNRSQFIEEAVQSVLNQNYPNVEHIIADGGSTDGTLEILRRHQHLRVISEPDQGVYDALNKGLARASGEIIGHLNSDDFYEQNVFASVAKRFVEDPGLDAVSGGAVVFEEQADGTRRTIAEYLAPRDVELSYQNITVGVPIINARFFRKRVYDQVDLYDTRYRIAADRDFLLRAAQAGIKSEPLGCLVYHYRQHPGSLSISGRSLQRLKMAREYLSIAERYLQSDGVSSHVRRVCRLWYGKEAAEGVVLALREKRYLEAVRFGMRGWRHDRWWPIAFASLALPRIARLLFRRCDE